MTTLLEEPQSRSVKAVSFPCGPARQYRVQTCDLASGEWRKFGTFGRRDAAMACVDDLKHRGYQARLIDYRCCPTAG